jgi:hypothetical protein
MADPPLDDSPPDRDRLHHRMTWRALPHRPIEKLDDNLWRVEGDLPRGPMPRAMTIVRLADGRLLIHSAIALSEPAMREMEAWGTPAIVIVPNDRHRLDAAAYKQRYSAAQIVCPAGARDAIEQKVHVDATEIELGETARYRVVDGTGGREGWLEVRHGARATVVLGDLIMNLRPMGGFGGWIMNRMGFTGAAPKIVPATRKALVKDAAALHRQLDQIAAVPGLQRVVVAHGAPIVDAPADALRAIGAALDAR